MAAGRYANHHNEFTLLNLIGWNRVLQLALILLAQIQPRSQTLIVINANQIAK